jgi:hypothetical protein
MGCGAGVVPTGAMWRQTSEHRSTTERAEDPPLTARERRNSSAAPSGKAIVP